MNQKLSKTAIISIDVETDWGGRLPASVETIRGVKVGLPQIFEILNQYQCPATLFINGEIVPYIQEELNIAIQKKFEIGSHGFTHRKMPELSKDEIIEELSKSKAILEEYTGQKIRGFRAPQARIPEGLYHYLKQTNYEYDSSVFAGKMPSRFNNQNVPFEPYLQDNIWEIPVNSLPLIPLPMGLLWIDLFQLSLIQLLSSVSPLPPIVQVYMHPFDFIPAYSVEDLSIPWGAKLWYTRQQGSALKTLNCLLYWLQQLGYTFKTAGDVINSYSML
ncbi:polysaccharide deacetylase family protein [Planktothrix sp. FACHB-1365]|uniref:polysaccharide deacetylase family protein n=1 Tax=Planktothrix sp. FACHB-1365 TaxID=2692855 RepID=UPI00168A3C36|nr:polysaccharide deacetylase family protein [Planktothrix sp. FACHB-1365]MBD2485418.1 polysaccharide deacetylase family protein [Planktothrix sp. FACHB-1365]